VLRVGAPMWQRAPVRVARLGAEAEAAWPRPNDSASHNQQSAASLRPEAERTFSPHHGGKTARRATMPGKRTEFAESIHLMTEIARTIALRWREKWRGTCTINSSSLLITANWPGRCTGLMVLRNGRLFARCFPTLKANE